MWPPPEIPDNIPLQKLLGAQKLLQEKQRARQPEADGGSMGSSGSIRQQGSMKKQPASPRAAPKPAGRAAELVRGLLATRNIEVASMDREAIEKLRVRGSNTSACLKLIFALWQALQCSLLMLLQPQILVLRALYAGCRPKAGAGSAGTSPEGAQKLLG